MGKPTEEQRPVIENASANNMVIAAPWIRQIIHHDRSGYIDSQKVSICKNRDGDLYSRCNKRTCSKVTKAIEQEGS